MRRIKGGKGHRGHGIDWSDGGDWTHLGANDGSGWDGGRSMVVGNKVLSLSRWLHCSSGGNARSRVWNCRV